MDHSKIFKLYYSNKIQQNKPIVAIVDGKAVFLTWRNTYARFWWFLKLVLNTATAPTGISRWRLDISI